MRILLVMPHNRKETGQRLCPPMWPSVLAALTPDKHTVEFAHHHFDRLPATKLAGYDLVAISTATSTAKDAYRIADKARGVGVPVVMGGIHPYVMTEEAKAHCHCVVLGEAERTWPKVLRDLEAGKLQPLYQSPICRPEHFVVPDYSVTDNHWYYSKRPLEFVRGCPRDCDFCAATLYSGRKFRYKPLELLRRDLERWRRPGTTYVTNTNLVCSPRRTLESLAVIKEYGLKWNSPCDTTILDHADVLAAAADTGCVFLQFGFESISPETLKAMNKSHNVTRDYKALVKAVHDHGILAAGSFILGFDTDDRKAWKKTAEYALDIDLDAALFAVLTPYPGTRLHERLDREGRLLTKDWSRYNAQDVVYRPKNFTREQLIGMVMDANKHVTSGQAILKKMLRRDQTWEVAAKKLALNLIIKGGVDVLSLRWRRMMKENLEADVAFSKLGRKEPTESSTAP